MTVVKIAAKVPAQDGIDVPAGTGHWLFEPSRLRVLADHVVLPAEFVVKLAGGEALATFEPNGVDWCWVGTPVNLPGAERRYFSVPDSDAVLPFYAPDGATAPYVAEVDPDTLAPAADPEAAWWATVGQLDTDLGTQVVSGEVVGDDLVLTQKDGGTIAAGNVRGAVGPGASNTEVAAYVNVPGPTQTALDDKYGAVIIYDGSWAARPDAAISVRWIGGSTPPPGMTDADIWESIAADNGYAWHKDSYTAVSPAGSVITLGATPAENSITMFRRRSGVNEQLLEGLDYSVVANVITLYTSATGDIIKTTYAYTSDQDATGATVVENTTIVEDHFTRADSATTPGNADTGQAWIVPLNNAGGQPVFGISSNQLYCATAADNDNYAYVDAGVSDCTVQVKIAATGTSASMGLYVRASDAANGYTSSLTALFKRVAASNGTVITYSQAFVAGDTMRITMSGPNIEVFRDAGTTGAFVSVGTYSSATYQSNTKHGVRESTASTTGNRFDDFLVTA